MTEQRAWVSLGGQLRQQRHAQRLDGHLPMRAFPPDATPELAAAWHSLQLHWLRSLPSYREAVSRKVSETIASQELETFGRPRCSECGGELMGHNGAEASSRRALPHFTAGCRKCAVRKSHWQARQRRADVDLLGREVEGCG